MLERILVPLDGSEAAETVLPYVEELVSKLVAVQKVKITLLQVVSSLTHPVVAGGESVSIPYTEVEVEQIKKKAMNYLNKTSKGLRSKGVVVNCKVAVGRAADEIIKATDEINADLVAMSTHGRSGFRRWAFGSTTDHVLRGGHVPVLMVRVPREAEQT